MNIMLLENFVQQGAIADIALIEERSLTRQSINTL